MSSAAVLLLAAALVVWSPGRSVVAARARSLAVPQPGQVPGAPAPPGPRRRWLLAGAAGLAAGLLVGGLMGVLTAGVVGVVGERLLRGRDGANTSGSLLSADLPVACDLLAVCLAAGLPVGRALAAVAGALPAPLGAELATVAGLYRLGAPPRRAWDDVPPELAGLGRVVVRAGESGSAVVAALHALAGDTRAEARGRRDAAVRRAGVWVLAPLGACFLPAFLCLGVVPLVLGIAADVFG
ncbi:type II secretion system F family protein [Geodermatophilus sp. SYSU D00708]